MCKHFGGQCHELGVMLLVFTPCLYVNVSDAWMLKSKWQRAFIGAAGMYIEMWLAALATFVWWYTEPGLLNATDEEVTAAMNYAMSQRTEEEFGSSPLGAEVRDCRKDRESHSRSPQRVFRKVSQAGAGGENRIPDSPCPQRHAVAAWPQS